MMFAKPGDWICPNCGDHQFARNPSCRRCSAPKPQGVVGPAWKARLAETGAWDCPRCGDLQFSRNEFCRKCGCPRHKTPAQDESIRAGVANTDWICPKCGDLQFRRNSECRRCATPRPDPVALNAQRQQPQAIQAPTPQRPSAVGDWRCPNCQSAQFATSMICQLCSTPQPQLAGTSVASNSKKAVTNGGNKDGDSSEDDAITGAIQAAFDDQNKAKKRKTTPKAPVDEENQADPSTMKLSKAERKLMGLSAPGKRKSATKSENAKEESPLDPAAADLLKRLVNEAPTVRPSVLKRLETSAVDSMLTEISNNAQKEGDVEDAKDEDDTAKPSENSHQRSSWLADIFSGYENQFPQEEPEPVKPKKIIAPARPHRPPQSTRQPVQHARQGTTPSTSSTSSAAKPAAAPPPAGPISGQSANGWQPGQLPAVGAAGQQPAHASTLPLQDWQCMTCGNYHMDQASRASPRCMQCGELRSASLPAAAAHAGVPSVQAAAAVQPPSNVAVTAANDAEDSDDDSSSDEPTIFQLAQASQGGPQASGSQPPAFGHPADQVNSRVDRAHAATSAAAAVALAAQAFAHAAKQSRKAEMD